MNEHYKEDKPYCHFHPKEETIGVCHLCLNERLLILAADQALSLRPEFSLINKHKKKPPITLPKIFALGSLLHRFEFQHNKAEESHDCQQSDASAASLEDSFISIKFEDNGVASWEKSKVSKVSLDHCSIGWNQSLYKETDKSVVEHVKPHGSLRWRKRIGHVFQLSRWRRYSSHVGSKLEGVKVRSGWIRALTKRRTKE
ncbi:uncharacterized protein LOC131307562 [Rhododendron vialii]|uniref:uncharacterized protein LOC131307562 n=1 Tax=Rhododendron vialii TaxID=182163 RepID=UPI00265DC925|nr:uncharacterized protein LOC131307562 [Rhododendron vialii]